MKDIERMYESVTPLLPGKGVFFFSPQIHVYATARLYYKLEHSFDFL